MIIAITLIIFAQSTSVFHFDPVNVDLDVSDVLSFVSLVLSILSIGVAWFAVSKGKQTEIVYSKFDELCLASIRSKLQVVSDLITNHRNNELDPYTDTIKDIFRDIGVFLGTSKAIYSRIDVDFLTDLNNDFTDSLDLMPANSKLGDIHLGFNIVRLKLLNKIYNYAIDDVLSISPPFLKNFKHLLIVCIREIKKVWRK